MTKAVIKLVEPLLAVHNEGGFSFQCSSLFFEEYMYMGQYMVIYGLCAYLIPGCTAASICHSLILVMYHHILKYKSLISWPFDTVYSLAVVQ